LHDHWRALERRNYRLFGSVLMGWVATSLGPVVPLAAGGVACALGGAFFMRWFAGDDGASV
jgi:hypothetical protein